MKPWEFVHVKMIKLADPIKNPSDSAADYESARKAILTQMPYLCFFQAIGKLKRNKTSRYYCGSGYTIKGALKALADAAHVNFGGIDVEHYFRKAAEQMDVSVSI